MTGGWDVALDAQNDLWYSLNSDLGQRYLAAFGRNMVEAGQVIDADTLVLSQSEPDGERRQAVTTALGCSMASIEYGEPWWVNEDVLELVEVAAEKFEPEAVWPEDLFCPAAFVYLARPLYVVDRHAKRCAVRAFSWVRWQAEDNPGRQGVHVSLWADRDDRDDYSEKWDDVRMGLLAGSALSLSHTSGNIAFGDGRLMSEPTHHSLFRQLQVLWRLARQEVVVPGSERVARPVWRRPANWRHIKEVQVLKLRRARPRRYDGEEREVEWSHRWWVHGHWRNQWYPSVGQHFQIWVDGYVKGPEDKEFVPKLRAGEFIR